MTGLPGLNGTNGPIGRPGKMVNAYLFNYNDNYCRVLLVLLVHLV